MTRTEILLVAGMALVTLVIRYPLLALGGRLKLSPNWLRALRFVPPAVLTAIIVPAVVVVQGEITFHPHNPRLLAAIASVVVGVWRKNLLLTIGVGMGTFWLIQWLWPH
ncbi:MAG: AzlD domain-containing protein [Synechococcales cyanobacterium]